MTRRTGENPTTLPIVRETDSVNHSGQYSFFPKLVQWPEILCKEPIHGFYSAFYNLRLQRFLFIPFTHKRSIEVFPLESKCLTEARACQPPFHKKLPLSHVFSYACCRLRLEMIYSACRQAFHIPDSTKPQLCSKVWVTVHPRGQFYTVSTN